MSGDKLFVDTNVILYLLSGDQTLATLLDGKNLHLSFITELELLGFAKLDIKTEKSIINFIEQCTIIDINSHIKGEVIKLRRKYAIKLPDCIIMASSIYMDLPLITSDTDFKKIEEIDLFFYEKSF